MSLATFQPDHGCPHLQGDMLKKIQDFWESTSFDPDYVQYSCTSCPTTGSFHSLNDHFTQEGHEFAVSKKAIYCCQCQDLVYEPELVFPGRLGKKRKVVTLSKEDEEYIAQNTTARPCGREGVRGLFNLGETCYMNAVLQMMVHNPILSSYFLGVGHPVHTCPLSKEPEKKNDSDDSDDELNGDEKDQKTCVACAMTELFAESHANDQTVPAHAVNLLFASWKNIPHMSGKSQQDAHEWFMIIVDKLHEVTTNQHVIAANAHCPPTQIVNGAASKPDDGKHCNCFFHKIFYGRFYSEVTCETCSESSRSEEEYSSLSLDFKKQQKKKKKEANAALNALKDAKDDKTKGGPTSPTKTKPKLPIIVPTGPHVPNLYDCLTAYTAPEHLSSEEYNCPSCKTSRNATKRLRIRKLPAILCVHVKRFGMKKVGGQPTGFPEKYEGKLDFPLTLDMGPYTTSAEERGQYVYDLDSVVVHQGEHSQTGHYYAFCRMRGAHMQQGAAEVGPMPSGRWYRFDDEVVSATTTEEVLRQEAYLLFYGLRKMA